MKANLFLALAGLVAVAILSTGGAFAYRWYTAPIRGAVEQREITNQGGYRIQAYEQFYRWRESIIGIDLKLAAYPPSADLDPRQQTECRGLLAVRADLVSRYNAASSAVRTQGSWRAADLPPTLPQTNPRGC